MTGIASDIGKLRVKLCRNVKGIWEEIEEQSPFLPVLRKPNHYQNRIEFIEHWILSKLLAGNAYILLERDARRMVRAMYVLDPRCVKVLVAEDGSVFYELSIDNLSQVPEPITVPASEMIHDRMPALWHPLIGVSPIYACGISATMGTKIQANSTNLFANRSMPGGMLTAPGRISQETAERMKAKFESNYGGANIGRPFVGGDGLKFEPIVMTAENAQLADQLKWTVSDVARAFHYPEYKLGGPLPPYSGNMQALTLSYYTDCLQTLIEKIEICLDEALDLGRDMGTEIDIDNLMRMDTASLMESINKGAGTMAPNEGRRKLNLPPVPGGDAPYLQQQNYSLEALAKRDASADPFASKAPASNPEQKPVPAPAKGLDFDDVEFLEAEFRKELIPA